MQKVIIYRNFRDFKNAFLTELINYILIFLNDEMGHKNSRQKEYDLQLMYEFVSLKDCL